MAKNERENDELEDEFEIRVRRQSERIATGKKERDSSFWRYVGLIGLIGWSVVIPMVLGALLGYWLDLRFDTGYRWTLGLMLLGLLLGGINAWRVMMEER